jgi:6-phosphogluconolactonase/glucosamine-6-phosphate isomerase/deaminase
MQLYKIGVPELAIGPLVSKLKSSLYIGPTLWLVSGGSNIPISVSVMQALDSDLSANLTVALTDERYGQYNHPESNWTKLKNSGFDPKRAHIIEPLKEDTSAGLDSITAYYAAELETALDNVNTAIGQFGMGEDGHIAGILPQSPAARELPGIITSYASEPYTRITITFNGIRRLNCSFLIAMGASKLPQLERLISQDLPLSDQPAQIIKQIEESFVYNDQIGGRN